MIFEFEATISSSYLTQFNDPRAPHGSTLYGIFTYDADLAFKSGWSYYFDPGEAFFSVYAEEGFKLDSSNRVTNVAPTSSGDFFTVQSFVSEDPNGWNMFFDLSAQNWLNGSDDLPGSFNTDFDNAYFTAYFTDEYDWVRVVDATIETITAIDPADLAQNDDLVAKAYGGEWVRVAALMDDTDLLGNDYRGTSLISIEIDGQTYGADGIWRDADGGGQIRVFENGAVDFRNRGDTLEDGGSARFIYHTETLGVASSAEATITFTQAFDAPKDDTYVITVQDLTEGPWNWVRIAALKDDSDLLENDLGADEILFINGEEIAPGTWFDGDNGGQFRVFRNGAVDFRPTDVSFNPTDTTGFTYGVEAPDGKIESATVMLGLETFEFL